MNGGANGFSITLFLSGVWFTIQKAVGNGRPIGMPTGTGRNQPFKATKPTRWDRRGNAKGRYTMSWETRRNGSRYYTRSRRVGGRIQREYVGGGRVGELAARLDQINRESRFIEAETIRQLSREAAQMDEELAKLEKLADSIGRGLLILAGYHQHNRSEWRKRNERK